MLVHIPYWGQITEHMRIKPPAVHGTDYNQNNMSLPKEQCDAEQPNSNTAGRKSASGRQYLVRYLTTTHEAAQYCLVDSRSDSTYSHQACGGPPSSNRRPAPFCLSLSCCNVLWKAFCGADSRAQCLCVSYHGYSPSLNYRSSLCAANITYAPQSCRCVRMLDILCALAN
jgi:hypothetical protein